MKLNDLLEGHQIDPRNVLVFRHRPHEQGLRKVLPWLAADKPEMFNAYQQTQGPKLERAMQAMTNSGWVASFIGHEPGRTFRRLVFNRFVDSPHLRSVLEGACIR